MQIQLGTLADLNLTGLNDLWANMRRLGPDGRAMDNNFSSSRHKYFDNLKTAGLDKKFYRHMRLPGGDLIGTLYEDKLYNGATHIGATMRRNASVPTILTEGSNYGHKWTRFSSKHDSRNLLPLYEPYFKPTGRISDLTFLSTQYMKCFSLEKNKKGRMTITLDMLLSAGDPSDFGPCLYIVDAGDHSEFVVTEEFESKTKGFHNCLILYLVRNGAKLTVNRKISNSDAQVAPSTSYENRWVIESQIIQFPESELTLTVESDSKAYLQDLYFVKAHEDTVTNINGEYSVGYNYLPSDNHIVVDIDHIGNGSTSKVNMRTAAYNSSLSTFAGNITVGPDVQDIDAKLYNRNLTVDPNTKVITEPNLNISNHNIECSHGCTTSPVRPEDLYVFTSRGIHPEIAQVYFIEAFLKGRE